jgi:hypothetical protein
MIGAGEGRVKVLQKNNPSQARAIKRKKSCFLIISGNPPKHNDGGDFKCPPPLLQESVSFLEKFCRRDTRSVTRVRGRANQIMARVNRAIPW